MPGGVRVVQIHRQPASAQSICARLSLFLTRASAQMEDEPLSNPQSPLGMLTRHRGGKGAPRQCGSLKEENRK